MIERIKAKLIELWRRMFGAKTKGGGGGGPIIRP